jgi:hypothetical protein
LLLQEDKGLVYAHLPAKGDWPAAGATIDLYALRNAAKNLTSPEIELHAVAEGVLVPTDRGYARFNLLAFGPSQTQAALPVTLDGMTVLGPEDLPLFRWAATRPSG